MELDLEAVAAFTTLAEEMHFGRAAARLHLGPPALTKRIHRLESQLHVSLVERGGCGVEGLTRAGSQFLSRALPLLAQARQLKNSMMVYPREILTIGVTCAVGAAPTYQQMMDVAVSYTRVHRDVIVKFRGVPANAGLGCLDCGEVDLVWGNFTPTRSNAVDLTALGKFGKVATVTTESPTGWSVPARLVQDFLFVTPFCQSDRWLSPYRISAPGVEWVPTYEVPPPNAFEIFAPRSADRVDRTARTERRTDVIYSSVKSARDAISNAVILRGDLISECYVARRINDRRPTVMGLLEHVEEVSAARVLRSRPRGTYPALQDQERLQARVSDDWSPEAQPFDSVADAGTIGRSVTLLDPLQLSGS